MSVVCLLRIRFPGSQYFYWLLPSYTVSEEPFFSCFGKGLRLSRPGESRPWEVVSQPLPFPMRELHGQKKAVCGNGESGEQRSG